MFEGSPQAELVHRVLQGRRRAECAGQAHRRRFVMALFVIEREFAEQLEITTESVRLVSQINAEIGVHWLFSFLSADKKKTYCLYEAPNVEAIREAARRANLPADVIVEVSELRPESFV
jgi:hypothetical protein